METAGILVDAGLVSGSERDGCRAGMTDENPVSGGRGKGRGGERGLDLRWLEK